MRKEVRGRPHAVGLEVMPVALGPDVDAVGEVGAAGVRIGNATVEAAPRVALERTKNAAAADITNDAATFGGIPGGIHVVVGIREVRRARVVGIAPIADGLELRHVQGVV